MDLKPNFKPEALFKPNPRVQKKPRERLHVDITQSPRYASPCRYTATHRTRQTVEKTKQTVASLDPPESEPPRPIFNTGTLERRTASSGLSRDLIQSRRSYFLPYHRFLQRIASPVHPGSHPEVNLLNQIRRQHQERDAETKPNVLLQSTRKERRRQSRKITKRTMHLRSQKLATHVIETVVNQNRCRKLERGKKWKGPPRRSLSQKNLERRESLPSLLVTTTNLVYACLAFRKKKKKKQVMKRRNYIIHEC